MTRSDAFAPRARRARTSRRALRALGAAIASLAASERMVGARAGGVASAVLRAAGSGGGGSAPIAASSPTAAPRANASASASGREDAAAREVDANARESDTAAAIRRGARVRLTDARARELVSSPMIALYGGLEESGETTNALDVLTGSGSGDYLVWCHRGGDAFVGPSPAMASMGTAVYSADKKVLFHGGYKIWDAGSEFEDRSSTHAFNMHTGAFECLTEANKDAVASLGKTGAQCPKLAGASTGKRDEEVAVITAKPIRLPKVHAHTEAALGKHMASPELPALDVDDDDDASAPVAANDSDADLGGEAKQHAMIIFGGRDENDERLDSVYALGLDDKQWRKIDYELPDARDDMVPQGPFEMPLIIKNAHKDGTPFPLGRSGATAVVTKDNKMIIYGGFVVEGRLGFNVGETLVLDLDKMKFSYPMASGNMPVRRNKHSAVLDDKDRMWIWGGSVWDHTGGSSTYASTATYYADVSDPKSIVWHRVATTGKPPSQRRFHTAVIMDGGMYIIGGEDYRTRTYLSDVHRLDLDTLTWTQPAVLGGIKSGRIRASVFPWATSEPNKPSSSAKSGSDGKHDEASLGRSHHHDDDQYYESNADEKPHKHADADVEGADVGSHAKAVKKMESSIKETEKSANDANEAPAKEAAAKAAANERDDAKEADSKQAGVVDIATCGTGEQARVRTGENQPDIEHLVSVLVDGSTLAAEHGALGEHEDASAVSARLAKDGWLPNTARGSSILTESSMVWRKAPGIGAREGLPGWISDADSRDKSILTETLSADPEASSIESRLLEAIKSVAGDSKLKSSAPVTSDKQKASNKRSVEDELDEAAETSIAHEKSHTKKSKVEDESDEQPESSKMSKNSKTSKSSKVQDEEVDEEQATHSAHKKHAREEEDEVDEEERARASHKHGSHHEDDEEEVDEEERARESHKHHGSHHEDDDEEVDEEESAHSRSKSHENSHEKVHLSAAARMLERIEHGNREASLGTVIHRTPEETSSRSHMWAGVAFVALAMAVIINTRTAKQTEQSLERIPLVLSTSISDSPSKSAKWQQDAMVRRGLADQYAKFGTDEEATVV